jgi:four helix bundle protein
MAIHKNLDVWKLAMQLAKDLYVLTKLFPADEKFGLISQMKRAVSSVPLNISEGAARQYNKEYIQFLYIALESLSEVDTLLELAFNLDYIKIAQYEQGEQKVTEIRNKLLDLIKYLKSK